MDSQLSGCIFGSHRVIEPIGVLPQPATRIDNDMDTIRNNEILVGVDTLNIDSASFTQIEEEAGGDVDKIKQTILGIVAQRGKMQNPVTGSGGMFIGTVEKVGELLANIDLKPGDRIASLVSLSLTPLRIDEIVSVNKDTDQVTIKGKAVLFESGLYAKLPEDIPAKLALAVLDVCGAPAQTARLVKHGYNVVIIGAAGKSGVLCSYVAKKLAGSEGKVIGLGNVESANQSLRDMGFCDHVLTIDATDALKCYREISFLTEGRLADVVINCVNVPNTEMPSILMCRENGTIYFFSMATSFSKAALGAEGVGKDVNMMIGNGYAKGHAQLALDILRESSVIRNLYESVYC